jgi:transposase
MERKVKYDYEFKFHCVNEVLKNKRSIANVANENGFDESGLRKWISFYQKYGTDGLIPRENQNKQH